MRRRQSLSTILRSLLILPSLALFVHGAPAEANATNQPSRAQMSQRVQRVARRTQTLQRLLDQGKTFPAVIQMTKIGAQGQLVPGLVPVTGSLGVGTALVRDSHGKVQAALTGHLGVGSLGLGAKLGFFESEHVAAPGTHHAAALPGLSGETTKGAGLALIVGGGKQTMVHSTNKAIIGGRTWSTGVGILAEAGGYVRVNGALRLPGRFDGRSREGLRDAAKLAVQAQSLLNEGKDKDAAIHLRAAENAFKSAQRELSNDVRSLHQARKDAR